MPHHPVCISPNPHTAQLCVVLVHALMHCGALYFHFASIMWALSWCVGLFWRVCHGLCYPPLHTDAVNQFSMFTWATYPGLKPVYIALAQFQT